MKMGMMIDPPTPERQVQRIIDAFGYHDAEAIPTADVVNMLLAYQGFETRTNAHLLKLLSEFQAITPMAPIVMAKSAAYDPQTP